MIERSQNSNHNLEMLPSLIRQSPNFKAFHDLTLAFLFGLIVLFFFFHPRLQKVQCFPKFSSFMLLYLYTCCSLLCSEILPRWQTLIFQDSAQTVPFSWSLFWFFLYSTEATTHPLYPHGPCINFEALVCFSPLQGNNLFDSKDCV